MRNKPIVFCERKRMENLASRQ